MSFTSLLIHDVTVYNLVAGSTDRYGNETKVWDAGTVVPGRIQAYLNLALRPREELEDRDTRTEWFRGFFLPDAPITSLSELGWEGRRLQIEGEPAMVWDGVGAHHVQLIAKEQKG